MANNRSFRAFSLTAISIAVLISGCTKNSTLSYAEPAGKSFNVSAESALESDGRRYLYSKESLLREDRGKLYGGWDKTFSGACAAITNFSYIDKNGYDKRESVGKCSQSSHEIVKFRLK